MIILKNKNELKGSKIYINNDLTVNEWEIQLKLQEIADKGEKIKIDEDI